jgi:hypothetical protein
MATSEELAWSAGFFDGEGCVGLRRRPRCVAQLQISISQCDRRVLDRFAAAVGGGRVYGPHTPAGATPNQNPRYQYVATGASLVPSIMDAIYPWLSAVKREQYERTMAAHARAKMVAVGAPGSRATCKRGHAFTPENTKVYFQKDKRYRSRGCKACAKEHVEQYRRRRLVAALLEA